VPYCQLYIFMLCFQVLNVFCFHLVMNGLYCIIPAVCNFILIYAFWFVIKYLIEYYFAAGFEKST